MKPKFSARLICGVALLCIVCVLLLWCFHHPAISFSVVPQISAGDGHAIALMPDGRLYSWGRNEFGQAGGFGPGLTQWISPTIYLQRATNWARIAAGDNHSLAIKSDGSLWAWGRNDYGQMGIGRYDDATSPSGMPTMRPNPMRVGLETNWVAVAGGVCFSVGLKTDGTLWTWGANWAGQLGDEATNKLCALFTDFELASRAPKTNRPTAVGTDRNWSAIACGAEHVLALKSDGSLWAWGRNDCGQLGDGTTEHRNQPTRIGNGNDWTAIAAGGGFTGGHSVALKGDGSLWLWGNYCPKATVRTVMNSPMSTQPKRVGTDTNWVKIAAGDGLTLAIKRGGTLWAMGLDCSGIAGKQNATLSQLTRIGRGSDWIGAVAEGVGYYGGRNDYCIYGLKSDGTLWVWGGDLRRPGNTRLQKLQAWLLKIGIKATWLNPPIRRPAQLLAPRRPA